MAKMTKKQKKKFAKKLKYILNGRNIHELAEESGVSRSYLSRFIGEARENKPTPKILEKLANSNPKRCDYVELMKIVGYLKDDINIGFSEDDENIEDHLLEYAEMVPLYNFNSFVVWDRDRNTGRKYNFTSSEVEFFPYRKALKADYAVKMDKDIKEIAVYRDELLLIKELNNEIPNPGSTVLVEIKGEEVIRTVKRIYRLDNCKFRLEPTRRGSLLYERSDLRIIGKVILQRKNG